MNKKKAVAHRKSWEGLLKRMFVKEVSNTVEPLFADTLRTVKKSPD